LELRQERDETATCREKRRKNRSRDKFGSGENFAFFHILRVILFELGFSNCQLRARLLLVG